MMQGTLASLGRVQGACFLRVVCPVSVGWLLDVLGGTTRGCDSLNPLNPAIPHPGQYPEQSQELYYRRPRLFGYPIRKGLL